MKTRGLRPPILAPDTNRITSYGDIEQAMRTTPGHESPFVIQLTICIDMNGRAASIGRESANIAGEIASSTP